MIEIPEMGGWIEADGTADHSPFSLTRRISAAVRDRTHWCIAVDSKAGSVAGQIKLRARMLEVYAEVFRTRRHKDTFVMTTNAQTPGWPRFAITIYGFAKSETSLEQWRAIVGKAAPWSALPSIEQDLVMVANREDYDRLNTFMTCVASGNAMMDVQDARFPRDEEK